jgi:hypothetical protein
VPRSSTSQHRDDRADGGQRRRRPDEDYRKPPEVARAERDPATWTNWEARCGSPRCGSPAGSRGLGAAARAPDPAAVATATAAATTTNADPNLTPPHLPLPREHDDTVQAAVQGTGATAAVDGLAAKRDPLHKSKTMMTRSSIAPRLELVLITRQSMTRPAQFTPWRPRGVALTLRVVEAAGTDQLLSRRTHARRSSGRARRPRAARPSPPRLTR